MTVLLVPGVPGTTLRAGLPDPGGSLVTTLSLVNTSGSTQAANFVSPMLGMPFKAGDLPSGEYPVFTLDDDTPCPATTYKDSSWADGSKKLCGVFFRTPVSIAGSASLNIKVKSGGTAPAASSRTLSDVTAADLKVELTGVTNLSGVWTASLNTAIIDAAEIQVIGDGPAGKVWRIRGAFKQSGAAHGQLECYHHLLVAENSAGGFSHIEYLPRVAQPWSDVSSPTATRRVVTCVLKSGATTLLTMQGHDTTETLGANIAINHYGSFYVCDTDGRWNFIQGGGTTSARSTVRVQHNKDHVVSSRLLESYDTAQSVSSNASVNYAPGCLGSFQTRDLNSTGPSNFIGLIPEWCTTHLLTQAAVDERAVRVSSLAAGGFRNCLRRSTTGEIVPVSDVSASYPGLGTIQTTWQYGDGYFAGVQTPAVTTSLWNGDTDTSHRPSPHYYAAIITGEPQYFDMLEEQGAQAAMLSQPGLYERNVTAPIASLVVGTPTGRRDIKVGATTYKGAGLMFFGDQVRTSAWASRDVAHAAAILPDTSLSRPYLREVLDSAHQTWNAVNTAMPTSWRNSGLISLASNSAASGSSDSAYESTWMTMYFSLAVCQQSQILGTANAATLRAHLAKFISSAHAAFDVAALGSYRWKQWDGAGNLVTDIADALFYHPVTLTFDATANTVTRSGTLGTFNWTNGDKVAFSSKIDADKPFVSATDHTVFFAVSSSGGTCALAATAGGSAIDVTSAVTVTPSFLQLQNASPTNAYTTGGTELALARGAARFHEACGDSVVSSARAALDTRLTGDGWSFTTDPRFAYAPTFPA